jgi:hypothetical protein
MSTTNHIIKCSLIACISLILSTSLLEGLCADHNPTAIYRPTTVMNQIINLLDQVFSKLGHYWAMITGDLYRFFEDYVWYYLQKYFGIHSVIILEKFNEMLITPITAFFKGFSDYFDSSYLPNGVLCSFMVTILLIYLIDRYPAKNFISNKFEAFFNSLMAHIANKFEAFGNFLMVNKDEFPQTTTGNHIIYTNLTDPRLQPQRPIRTNGQPPCSAYSILTN